MTPAEVADRLAQAIRGALEPAGGPPAEIAAGVDDGRDWCQAVVDVPPAGWRPAARVARDEPDLDLSYFDWLSGVDEQDGGFGVVAHLWSVRHRHGALLRTRVSRQEPRLASLVPVFAGAAWHERETFEMFGVVFEGHPRLEPLLLPDGFTGHPLRKDFVLASRVAKEWPGAKEPGESHTGATRRRMRPPGVPEDWPRDA
jgi:NADH-quinone oxidoreductase subunit C